MVVGHNRGRLECDPLDGSVAAVLRQGALPAGSSRFAGIVSVDGAAVVKVVDYLGSRFMDYLTVLEHEGR
jgi:hypothetical protein